MVLLLLEDEEEDASVEETEEEEAEEDAAAVLGEQEEVLGGVAGSLLLPALLPPLADKAGRTLNLSSSLLRSLPSAPCCSNSRSCRWKPMLGLAEVRALRTACRDSCLILGISKTAK